VPPAADPHGRAPTNQKAKASGRANRAKTPISSGHGFSRGDDQHRAPATYAPQHPLQVFPLRASRLNVVIPNPATSSLPNAVIPNPAAGFADGREGSAFDLWHSVPGLRGGDEPAMPESEGYELNVKTASPSSSRWAKPESTRRRVN
jgi:hypothetical protein